MNVSDNIRAIRTKKGLSQAEMARRYGTSPEFYHRLEKKDKTLTLEQVEKIADALGVTVVELLSLEVEVPKIESIRLEQLEKAHKDLTEVVQEYRKKIEELENRLADKDFIIKHYKKEVSNIELLFRTYIEYLKHGIIFENEIGTIRYTDDNGNEQSIAGKLLSSDEEDALFEDNDAYRELSEDDEKQIIHELFYNPKYEEFVAFLVSSGLIEDDKILQAYKARYPDYYGHIPYEYQKQLINSKRKIVDVMNKKDSK